MSWLERAIDDPAPAAHAGYSGLHIAPEVDAALKSGAVVHSAAGLWSPPGYKPSDLMRSRGNSWDATIMVNGDVWRHRPRPTFVNWHAGGPAQNVPLCGFETEGTGPWTAAQKASLVRVLTETWAYFGWQRFVKAAPTDKTQDGIRQAILAAGKGCAYEHNWLDYTSCPGGRDDWGWLVPAAKAALEEEMTPAELFAQLKKDKDFASYLTLIEQLRRAQGTLEAQLGAHVGDAAKHAGGGVSEERVAEIIRELVAD